MEKRNLIAEFRQREDHLKRSISTHIKQKEYPKDYDIIAGYSISELENDLKPLRRELKIAALHEEAKAAPGRAVYLNLLLYRRLQRLAPQNTLYEQKTAHYLKRYKAFFGKEYQETLCQDHGFLRGRCLARTMIGKYCAYEEELQPLAECKRKKDTFIGFRDGVTSVSP